MRRHLFFICPTDHLEPVINEKYRGENYFITSLGNSIAFNEENLSEIVELLATETIKNVSFVMCSDNRIVLDVLNENELDDRYELVEFQNKIRKQREYAEAMWQNYDCRTFTISHYLNQKIKNLNTELNQRLVDSPRINAIIYSKKDDSFEHIYSGLIYANSISIN